MTDRTIKIGYLRDVYVAGSHDFGGNALRMVIDDTNRAGGLHGRQVELVTRVIERGPGTQDNVVAACAAWDEIVHGERVLGLIGPSTTPVALAVLDRVEQAAIPAIHWAGTDAACSSWQFQYQAGYLPDEGPALAFLLARRGHRRVACFRSAGAYGQAYLDPFLDAAQAARLEIACEQIIPLDTADIGAHVDAAMKSEADALVAVGLFGLGAGLAKATREREWSVARYGNCGFALIAGNNSQAAAILEGWLAVDLFDPANPVAAELANRYQGIHGVRPGSASTCFGRDLATLMVEGLRRAPELSRSGLRAGLQSLRNLPAAAGGAGTRMGFGITDRLALKGPRVFVFNEITAQGLRPYSC